MANYSETKITMKREELPNEASREDKMREALAHYEELATKACWHRSDIPEAIRAYYDPLPPAEGAEEIDKLIKKHVPIDVANFEFCVKHNMINGGLLQGIRDVATLHAQRLAEKMVEDMRQKLFSMGSTKEAMDKLSEADRLMQYGYHDCINEMLMWTKNLSHD